MDMIATVELHLSGRWLFGPPINRIGLALRVTFFIYFIIIIIIIIIIYSLRAIG